jgi:hypothetical protein
MRKVSMTATFLLAFGFAGFGCAGATESGDGPLTNRPAGTNLSEEDLTGFDVRGWLSSAGGAVRLADNTVIYVAPGSTSSQFELGVKPLGGAPDVSYDGTDMSGWYSVALSVLDATASPDMPFMIDVPISQPTDPVHPGLQLLMALPGGYVFAIDGIYSPWTGLFRAVLPALPPVFDFAVVFNPAIQRLNSSDVPDAIYDSPLVNREGEPGWSTVEWVIDFDQNKVTLAQARKVAAAARKAARIYSEAGFKEPFLYKEKGVFGERWHIHLATEDEGSSFESTNKPASLDAAEHFGRVFVGVGRIDSPLTDQLGSVVASVAHEMMHAIFFNYKIPSKCFNYVSNRHRWCYPSDSGFDEGMAVATAYMIDQGTAKPRTSQAPCLLSTPVGYFDENDQGRAYRNQDYYVFLLRTGSIVSIRKQMESLALTVLPTVVPAVSDDILAAYQLALETNGVGLDLTFTEMLGAYVARRAYIRDAEGYLWPNEPYGGEKGATYVLDMSLFGTEFFKIDPTDCAPGELETVCSVNLRGDFPGAGYLLDMDISKLSADWAFTPGAVTVAATTAGAKTTFWLFGEKGGVGSEAQSVWSRDGSPQQLTDIEGSSPQIRVLLAQGPAKGMITVTLTITPGEIGPECQKLATCCASIALEDSKTQCNAIVKKGNEADCTNSLTSFSSLCAVTPKQTTCTAQLNNVLASWDGKGASDWSVTYSTLGKVQGAAFSGTLTDEFMDFTDTMTAECSGTPSNLTGFHVARVYSLVAVNSDFRIANVPASYGDLNLGSYSLTGTAVCDAMQFSGTGLDSISCTANTAFYLDCSSF